MKAGDILETDAPRFLFKESSELDILSRTPEYSRVILSLIDKQYPLGR